VIISNHDCFDCGEECDCDGTESDCTGCSDCNEPPGDDDYPSDFTTGRDFGDETPDLDRDADD